MRTKRRAVMGGAIVAGMSGLAAGEALGGEAAGGVVGQERGREGGGEKKDIDFVLAAGMTEAEAECWSAVARAAGLFFELPELHTMDKAEVASAIHVVQNKLLSRPTYRKYLEEAKKGRG